MILAILQARVSSTRLPGKVLKPILGVPMILCQIERIKQAKKIDKLIVATSIDTSDDALEKVCHQNNIECFRGSLNDVLDRVYQATRLYCPEHIVRLTGDCPLTDPTLIDKVIQKHVENHFDATCADMNYYPDGLDVEVFTFSSLQQAWKEAGLKSEREHVGPYIWKHSDIFRLGKVENSENLSNLRWTVDEKLDFELVSKIYEGLYTVNPQFGTNEILEFLKKHRELATMNIRYKRNEGYIESLKSDFCIKG